MGRVLAGSAEQKRISESSGNQHFRLASVDVASGQSQVLISSPGLDEGAPALSPDGKTLAYVVNELNENFWRINLSRGSPNRAAPPVKLENSVRQQWDPSYSPDGRGLAFGSNRSGSDQIWVSDAQGGGPFRLPTLQTSAQERASKGAAGGYPANEHAGPRGNE